MVGAVFFVLSPMDSSAQNAKGGIIGAEEITKTLAPEQAAPESGASGGNKKVLMRGLSFRGIGKVKRRKPASAVDGTAQISIPILFKTNSDELDEKAVPQLEQIAVALKTEVLSKYKIVLEGHTDSVGATDYNLDLSKRRANSVRAHLVNKGGIAENRLAAVGKGEAEPVASNATARGREKNRRVTLIRQGLSP